MAEPTTFLQHWIFTQFLFPFLLIFFIVFAILEKTKLLGEGGGKKQINALIAFVIGLIFVGAIYPKLVVTNMVLFLTVALVVVFVVLLIWGFIFGDKEGFSLDKNKWMKWGLGVITGIAIIGGILWATGLWGGTSEFFRTELAQNIITNAAFVLVIAIALALVLIGSKGKS